MLRSIETELLLDASPPLVSSSIEIWLTSWAERKPFAMVCTPTSTALVTLVIKASECVYFGSLVRTAFVE